jgi:SOS-response transcriptional repressor LexA
MEITESNFNLKITLSILMTNRGLKVRDVVKATGLPQTTISSILSGKSKNPRPENLKLLANLFGLSVEQLITYKKLIPDTLSKNFEIAQNSLSLGPLFIPLIKWENVKDWLSSSYDINFTNAWLPNDTCKNKQSFALQVKSSMQFQFFSFKPIFLIDPQASIEDGAIILVFLDDSQEPVLRLLGIEGDKKWLHPLEKSMPSILLTSEHSIVGTVSEVRFKPRIS